MEDNDKCPGEKECYVHYRNDVERLYDAVSYGLIASYVGEWCVVTDDNLDDVPIIEGATIDHLLAMVADLDAPLYETRVYKVGAGALGDLPDPIDGTYAEFVHYSYKHNEYEFLKDIHDDVVNDVIRGEIDLGRSLMEQEMDEMLGWK